MLYNPLLKSFIEVVEQGSFSKAAEQLFISNTAIMKQMNQFERQCGFKIFDRTHSGVTLTQNGKRIYEQAKIIMKQSDDLLFQIRTKENVLDITIRVGTSYLDPAIFLTDIWSNLEKEYPNIHLEIVPFIEEKDGSNVFLKRIGKEFDVVVGCHSSAESKKKIDSLFLKEIPFSLCMNKNHELASNEQLEIEDLYGQTIMIGENTTDSLVEPLSHFLQSKEEIQLKRIPAFYDISTFNACASSNFLLVSMPHWANIHPSLITKKVNWPYCNRLSIFYDKNASKEILWFINIIDNYLKKNPNYDFGI